MATQAGDLRERIGFFELVDLDDGYGNMSPGFADKPTFVVSAKVVAKLGGETVQAARLAGRHYNNVTVRASTATRSVTTAWRAKDMRSGVIYNIRDIIDPDQKRQWIEMLCEQGVAA